MPGKADGECVGGGGSEACGGGGGALCDPLSGGVSNFPRLQATRSRSRVGRCCRCQIRYSRSVTKCGDSAPSTTSYSGRNRCDADAAMSQHVYVDGHRKFLAACVSVIGRDDAHAPVTSSCRSRGGWCRCASAGVHLLDGATDVARKLGRVSTLIEDTQAVR